jgi:hypothetical protein
MSKSVFLSDDFENKLRAATQMPDPNSAYVDQLWGEIQRSSLNQITPKTQSKMQKYPTFVLTGALITGLLFMLLLIGPQKVLAKVQSWFSAYFPVFGFVDSSNQVLFIPAPVRQERDGGVMTIDAAFSDPNRTILIIGESYTSDPCNTPAEQFDQPYLEAGEIRLDLDGWYASRLVFPALPDGIFDVTLHYPWLLFCDSHMPPWEIPLHFESAPPGMLMPIVDEEAVIQPPNNPSATPILTPLVESTPGSYSFPSDTNFRLEQIVELEKSVQISGLFSCFDPEAWYSLPEAEETVIMDTKEQILTIESMSPEEVWTLYPNLPPNTIPWAFRLPDVDLPDSLTLIFPYLLKTINLEEQPTFEVNFGSNPQPGNQWTPNVSIPLPGKTIELIKVYWIPDEGGNTLEFTFTADGTIEAISVLEADATSGGGGGNLNENELQPGQVRTTITLDHPIEPGILRYQIVSIQERISGPIHYTWSSGSK